MKAKVTDKGVWIPPELLEGAQEVEIRREGHAVLVLPLRLLDPIRRLGTEPIRCDVSDASADPDKYLLR
jgi:hypothetical protein